MRLKYLMAAALIAAPVAGQAAGYSVITSARVDDSLSSSFIYSGYNTRYDQGVRDDGPYGATHDYAFTACCGGASSGTTTMAPTATASHDQAAMAALGAPATAFARADLGTGQLGVSATGSRYAASGYTWAVSGTALAQFGDSLHFTVAGANAATVTDIGVTIDVHGSLAGYYAFLQSQLVLTSAGYQTAQFLNQISDSLDRGAAITYSSASGWVSYSFSPFTPDHLVFHGVYALYGASQSVDIGEALFANSAGGYSNYANTADLSFQLPDGVSFTSDSGVFLAAAGGVPEPASWAMMLLGFGAAGTAARRRRDALTPAPARLDSSR